MKILHVIPSLAEARGGPTQVVLNLVKYLCENGVDAEIATTNDNGAENDRLIEVPLNQKIDYQGVPVHFFPKFSSSRQRIELGSDKAFIFSPDLTRWLWQNIRNYDVLDNHYLFSYPSTCAGAIARWKRVPYTIRTMGQLTPYALEQSKVKKQLYTLLCERHNLNRAAAIHCTSQGEAEDVRNFGIKTSIAKLPLGVNQPINLPEAKYRLRYLYGISADTPVILFLGRLHRKKRPDLLVKALDRLAKEVPNFHLIMAGLGQPDYTEYLHNLVSTLGLESKTTFTGLVTGEDKDLLLQGSDLFVLPSFSENFGVAIAEAMIAGLPVVVTSDVQIAPEIAEAKAGIVIEGKIDSLKNAIAQLIKFPQLRQELGENSKDLATYRYSWNKIAQSLTDVYHSIIQN
jgi:glycosyltransferase involved in cell wall biosynthesis